MAAVVATRAQLDALALDELMPTDDDLLYEEELLRNPYSLKMWWRYLAARADAPPRRRHVLFERALKALPGSYKLWHAYLTERRLAARGARPDAPARAALRNTYERALVTMHKMPRIWLDYLELLLEGGAGLTATRRAFDRALAALPITQHDRVWALYLVRWERDEREQWRVVAREGRTDGAPWLGGAEAAAKAAGGLITQTATLTLNTATPHTHATQPTQPLKQS